jgi:uncharacterized protein YceK
MNKEIYMKTLSLLALLALSGCASMLDVQPAEDHSVADAAYVEAYRACVAGNINNPAMSLECQ